MRSNLWIWLFALACLVACERQDSAAETSDRAPSRPAARVTSPSVSSTTPAVPTSRSTKTPLDFGAAWKAILLRDDPVAQDRASSAMRDAWRGKRYRWTGAVLPGLCVEAKRTCAVNVFSRKTDPHLKWLGGFFPSVSFEQRGWDALHEKCRGESSCVITFDATLAEVRVEVDASLMLDFQSATILDARATRDDEGWFASKPSVSIPEERARANQADLRTGNPTKLPASLRRARTF